MQQGGTREANQLCCGSCGHPQTGSGAGSKAGGFTSVRHAAVFVSGFLAAQTRRVGLRASQLLSSLALGLSVVCAHTARRGAATVYPYVIRAEQACAWHAGVQTRPHGLYGTRRCDGGRRRTGRREARHLLQKLYTLMFVRNVRVREGKGGE